MDDKLIETFNTKSKKVNINSSKYFYLDVMSLMSKYFTGDAEKKLLLKRIGIKKFEKLQEKKRKYALKITTNLVKKEKKNSKKEKKKKGIRGTIPGGLNEMDLILNPQLPILKRRQKIESTPFGGQPGKRRRNKN